MVALIGTAISVAAKAAIIGTIGCFLIGNIADGNKVDTQDVNNISIASFSQDIQLPSTLYLPVFSLSPEEIFQGKILLFNVDFFGAPKTIYAKCKDKDGNIKIIEASKQEEINKLVAEEGTVENYYYDSENKKNDESDDVITSKQNIAADLSGTISKWYVQIRNIALVCMMIVLLYIGIRMLLSTLASDKAKYRQMLTDWFIGIMLIFLMHYIMAFSVTIVQKITDIVSSSIDENQYYVIIPADKDGKMEEFLNQDGNETFRAMAMDSEGNQITSDGKEEVSNVSYLMYPTNLMGQLRLQAELANYGTDSAGYSLCYIVLVVFTAVFIFTYLKRVLYMAFLTLIAPIVALTYPIDKINDGSAQGFNKWFREYIFNLLIQPMHLILYFVLITSAFQLSSQNILYSLVAIGFMIPAEKILRGFFGFEKSNTAGDLTTAVAGGALGMNLLNKMSHIGGKKAASSKSAQAEKGVRQKDTLDVGSNVENLEGEGINSVKELGEKTNQTANAGSINGKNDRVKTNEYSKKEVKAKNKSIPLSDRAKTRMKRAVIKGAKPTLKATRFMAKGASKGLIRGIGAGAAMSAGLAFGVATGDLSKTASYMGLGAAAGYTSGKAISNIGNGQDSTMTRALDKKLDIAYQRHLAKNEYSRNIDEQKVIKRRVKEAKEEFAYNGYSRKDIKKLEEDGTIARYAANNVESKNMIAIEKMRAEKGLTQKEGIAISEFNKKYGKALKEDKNKAKENIKEAFKEKGFSGTKLKKATNGSIALSEDFEKYLKKTK